MIAKSELSDAQVEAFQAEALNVACALGNAVKLHRACTYENPGEGLVSESEVTFLRRPSERREPYAVSTRIALS